MNTLGFDKVKAENLSQAKNAERGSATVIAVLVLGLLTTFVALSISRTSTESMVMANDAAEGRAYTAAEASLETMTRNFNKIFDIRQSPQSDDLTNVKNAPVPGFSGYTFEQIIKSTEAPKSVTIDDDTYKGLNALRDAWRLQTTATDNSTGVKVAMMREFYNNRIPIFQFGIFYEDDLELFNPPKMTFSGRVHSNKNLFVTSGSKDIIFNSRISAVGQFVTHTRRNGDSSSDPSDKIYVKNAAGSNILITKSTGSMLSTSSSGENWFGVNQANLPADTTLPMSKKNPTWPTTKSSVNNNILTEVTPLKLPITSTYSDMIELIRRGRAVGDLYNPGSGIAAVTTTTAESADTAQEKFANKPGIRISLADSKAKLPGCASGTNLNAVTTPCGVRLDATDGNGARGYTPLGMTDSGTYKTTRLNGERFYSTGREMWIKVEIVFINTDTALPQAYDITEDILSLGVTEQAPRITVSSSVKFEISGYNHTAATGTDARSIIKLQRFVIPGGTIPTSTTPYLSSYTWNSKDYNVVVRNINSTGVKPDGTCNGTGTNNCASEDSFANPYPATLTPSFKEAYHLKLAAVDSSTANKLIVPFPIQIFDTREGLYYDALANAPSNGKVAANGVMSLIDIDVANMKRFLNGEFDGKFPATTTYATRKNPAEALKGADVKGSNGWVVYVSDRRGDYDFDGEYDMEDLYSVSPGNQGGTVETIEDLNHNSILDVDYTNEAVRYNESYNPDYAAVTDHKYYRRGVRLINGTTLPGNYDATTPTNTKGFSVASENGIYVKGNYNATGVSSYPSGDSTPSTDFLPQNSTDHIPAAIMADAVTILSNGWDDAESFEFPYSLTSRKATETTLRFGMIAGDPISGDKDDTPAQGGGYQRLNGGVHNFKRYLEDWNTSSGTQVKLNYTGSLINLYNSRNNNSTFKCCTLVYNPPERNWSFDMSFTDPYRLPPGTPFFQYIQMTGFMRLNN